MDHASGHNERPQQTRADPSTSEPRPGFGNLKETSSSSAAATCTIAKDNIATQQLQDRAITVLSNHQLMMRYAIANDLSVPKVRVYFEKVAAGFEPPPIIKNWNVFDD